MFKKKVFVPDIKEGDVVEDAFVVKIKRGVKEYSNGFFVDLVLSDNSGKTIGLKYWGTNSLPDMRQLYESIPSDSIVLVKGRVTSYKGKLEISTNIPPKVLEKGEYDPLDFIKPPRGSLDEKLEEIMIYVDMISDENLRGMVKEIIEANKERFMKYPAAIEIHHNWIGGLMDHILEMLKIAEPTWSIYPVDKNIIISGIVLHDIGKLDELYISTRIKGSRIGQLAGHIVLGSIEVSKYMEKHGLDELTKEKLLHIIASHHGRVEYGSPKEPMFPEAVIVHEVDEMSSRVAEMLEFIKASKQETEDEFMYNRRQGRNILLK